MHLTESTETRKTAASGPDWSYWQHFEPRWSLGAEERAWLRGTGNVAVARGFGVALATVAGIATATSGFAAAHGTAVFVRLALGLAFIVLGYLVCRGKPWASLGLMALFTAYEVIRNLFAYLHGSPYYMNHLGFWLGEGVLTWALWIRVFYVAYRVELRLLQPSKADSQTSASR